PPANPDPLRRFALIFDRTCPDQSRLQDSFDLAQERSGASQNYPAFNAEIRSAVESALREIPWPEGARGRLAWFADVADEGVASLKGVAPIRAWDVRVPDTPLTGRNGLASAIGELTY